MSYVAWVMPGSQRGLGAIRLRCNVLELTRDGMMGALATRIDRLTRKEDPEAAAALLRRYEDEEGFSLEPATAAMVLAENSDRLWEAVGYQGPIKGPLEHDPATEAALEQETLGEFLATLYPPDRD